MHSLSGDFVIKMRTLGSVLIVQLVDFALAQQFVGLPIIVESEGSAHIVILGSRFYRLGDLLITRLCLLRM